MTPVRHIAERLEHIQRVSGNARPAERNGANVAEHRQEPFRAQDRRALANATHWRASDHIVVDRHEWQRRKSWELARHSPAFSLLSHFTGLAADGGFPGPTLFIRMPHFAEPRVKQSSYTTAPTTASAFQEKYRHTGLAFSQSSHRAQTPP
jgi:hypothetical protein